MRSLVDLSFVLPIYNEEETLPEVFHRIRGVLDSLPLSGEAVFVDDGSSDASVELLRDAVLEDSRFRVVVLSRNLGHQLAVTAGMHEARGQKAVFVLDGDLQDPPEMAAEFLSKMEEGFDVVYGVRKKRKEGAFLRLAYFLAYRLIGWLSNIELPLDAGDFAMMSRRVVDRMNAMPERNRYLRGMRAWVGYPQIGLEYERSARFAGESKYSFRMLLDLMYQGVFSFSEVPIRLMRMVGLWAIGICGVYATYLVGKYFVLGTIPEGFTSIILFLFFFFGLQTLFLGILGEYVARTLTETRGRQAFLVQEIVER